VRLILFDIDGTLIDSGGAGVRALDLAMKELFGIDSAFQGISMAGKTDPLIMREGLAKHGLPLNGTLEAVIETYLRHLRKEVQNDRKKLKPGIYDVLEKLRNMTGIVLGLLTGNLEMGARIKLAPFSINEYFPAGAFGSDDEDRNMLLPVAVRRFQELVQEDIRIEECVVIGDTPRDVECAKIYGASCFAVATGPYSADALREKGADYVAEDLSDHAPLLQFLNF
jgi:phosphoglycolate phosphatase-like HAD superfamily hydrolase